MPSRLLASTLLCRSRRTGSTIAQPVLWSTGNIPTGEGVIQNGGIDQSAAIDQLSLLSCHCSAAIAQLPLLSCHCSAAIAQLPLLRVLHGCFQKCNNHAKTPKNQPFVGLSVLFGGSMYVPKKLNGFYRHVSVRSGRHRGRSPAPRSCYWSGLPLCCEGLRGSDRQPERTALLFRAGY